MKKIRNLLWGILASGAILFGRTAEEKGAPGPGDLPSRSPSYIKIDVAANPTNDFRKAIATNDVRFVGYSGFAVVVPGVPDYYSRFEKSNGLKIIAGTSDAIGPDTFPIDVANRYAAAYNGLLLKHIQTGKGSAPYRNCVQIFNGENFEGWEADPSTWSIVDGAMRGVGGSSRLAYTKADYGSFRLIFTARMNPANRDHLGILFWGDRPKDPSKPKIDNAGWIQFMPPHGAMWDYHPPKHRNLPHETLAPGSRDFTQWSTTELLCNLEKGTMRAAVNGVEIARYTHPHPGERTDPEKRIIAGPIGMFRHGGGASEYKDIYLEADPKEDRLITVR